jgi:predicted nucleotidyltransferase
MTRPDGRHGPSLDEVASGARRHYGDRLVALVVFGSRGRGSARADSDLDLLVVADGLPHGRVARVTEFAALEAALGAQGALGDPAVSCSPVFKSPVEAEAGSPLFLDMVEDGRILFDRNGFFAAVLERLRTRLAALGARRVWRGNAWFWDLKPDYVPGEVFEL